MAHESTAPSIDRPDGQLTGRLGTGGIVFMVIAAAAPLTVIAGNVPLSVGLGNGAGAPVGFVIAATVLLLFAIGFVTMTPHVREAGAFFSYVTEGLGKRLGMGIAVVALVAYTAIQLGVYGFMGWAVNDTVKAYGGPQIPWPVYALVTIAIVAVLGYRHIELSAKVLGVALVLEVGVVVVLDAVIFASGGASGINVDSFTPSTIMSGSLGVPVLFALTGFIGFEATAVFRDEARDPERTIPRATYLAVLIIGGFYALSCWALVLASGTDNVVGVANATLAGEGNMLLDTTQQYLGTIGRDLINVLLISSLFACVLSFHNVIARYQYVLARKGLLPAALGRVHAQQHSPAVSSAAQTITATGAAGGIRPAGARPAGGGLRLHGRCRHGRHGDLDADHVRGGDRVLRPSPRAAPRPDLADPDRAGAGVRRPRDEPVAGAQQLHPRHRGQRAGEHRARDGSAGRSADRGGAGPGAAHGRWRRSRGGRAFRARDLSTSARGGGEAADHSPRRGVKVRAPSVESRTEPPAAA